MEKSTARHVKLVGKVLGRAEVLVELAKRKVEHSLGGESTLDGAPILGVKQGLIEPAVPADIRCKPMGLVRVDAGLEDIRCAEIEAVITKFL